MTQTIMLPSIAPGITRSVTVERGQYTCRILVDDVEVLSKIKGRPWVIALDLDDLTMIADAARGALRLTREGKE
tara:strand:- start:6454 stop:6675 length:222 start_codon:yes stop_codon:yes gene_type:complete